MFYDEENRAVGILLTDDSNEAGVIRFSNNPQNTYVGAKAFLDRYGIDYSKSRRYALAKEGDLLVFELAKPLGKQ